MKIVFMGTPEFAVPCLKALCESGEDVCAVFTQPDKPKGRGMKMQPTPVKEYAIEKDIPVYQPISLKKGDSAIESMAVLNALEPDLIVVVAYGNILPKAVLDCPKTYCINIHASLLPKYRGASPMQTALLCGETKTGVTSMLMEEGLDTGDMLIKEELDIGENDTASDIHDKLAVMGANVLLKTVEAIKNNTLAREKQDDALSCYAHMITKDMCPIDFTKSANEIHNQIRGLSSYPCALTYINGKRLKIYRSELAKKQYNAPCGSICEEKSMTVVCGDGYGITFKEVQIEGGKRMNASDFLRGNRLEKGTILG